MQKKILREFYCTPNHIYTNMILVCGMRSGKTQLGAMATTYELFKLILLGNPQKHYDLPPDQPIYILHVANSRDQARNTIFAQTSGLLSNSEWFVNHGMVERTDEFEFPEYSLHLSAEHSNSASLAGRTAKAVVLDETARFKDNKGKFSGEMVYFTVSRATKTFGVEGKVFSVSSPIWHDDFQMKLYRKGLKLRNFLCYQLPTWKMNPRFTRKDFDAEYELNPETAMRDFGAAPPFAVEAFFREPKRIDAAFDSSLPFLVDDNKLIPKIRPKPNTYYYLAGDPAVRNDAFGICLLHGEGNAVIVDFVHRFIREGTGEIDAFQVRDFIVSIANTFPLRAFIVDTWMYPETLQAIERAGVFVKQHTVKKQEYDCLKEHIYGGKIKIPVNEKLNTELKRLELVKGIKVDHPSDGSKDIADAVANALWELVEEANDKPEAYTSTSVDKGYFALPPILPIDESEFHEIDFY